VLGSLADLDQVEGRMEDARERSRESLRITEAIYGPDHPLVAAALGDLGELLVDGPDALAEGERMLRRAIAISETVRGPDSEITAIHECRLGMNLSRQGKVDEAIELLEATLALFLRKQGEEFNWTQTNREHLAVAYSGAGRHDESAAELRSLLAAYESQGRLPASKSRVHQSLGFSLHIAGKRDEGLAEFELAVELMHGSSTAPVGYATELVRRLAVWLRARGDADGAATLEATAARLAAGG
jgi:tetratricopeptide (TPR) repeat protein